MSSHRTWLAALALATVACGDDAGGEGGGTEGSSDSADVDDNDGDGPDGTAGDAGCEGTPSCAEPVAAECEGPTTDVELADPMPLCAGWTVSDDSDGAFEVGQTLVEFTVEGDGTLETCTTEVTVTDTVEPSVTCPAMEVLLRPAPDAEVVAPAAMADDACSDELEMSATPSVLPTGTTMVEYTATDPSGNVGSCSVEMGVVDMFAAQGFQMLDGTLLGSGETEVTFGWDPFESEFVSGFRLESSAAIDGPWTEVATLAADEHLHTMQLPDDVAYYRLVTVSAEGDGGATPPQVAYRISDEQYDIRDVPVATVPFDTTLYGVVRHPTALAEGPFPLVVMLHGNHGNCRDTPDSEDDFCSQSEDHECGFNAFTTPNAEGLTYLTETLAAQGMVSVTISGNAMNCRNDYILERSQLIAEHLRTWSDWNDGAGELSDVFEGTLDLSRVGLLGHSRGGDAVSNTPAILAADPIAGLEVRSIFALAPTDYHDVVLRDTHLATLLPSCDGDVATLSGRDHYDRSTDFDDDVHQSQLFFIGANHNFFNTSWTISDWEQLQPPDSACTPNDDFLMQVQQHSLSAMLGPWFAQTLHGDAPIGFQRAEVDEPDAYSLYAGDDLDWRWSYSAADRQVIDDFSGNAAPQTNALGGDNTFDDWALALHCYEDSCDNVFRHEQWAMRLSYDEDGMLPTARLGLEALDVSDAASLAFRVVSRWSSLNVGLDAQDFTIRVTDTQGEAAEFLLSDVKQVRHLYGQNVSREVLETVHLPTPMLLATNPDLDLSSLQWIEFEMTAFDTGSVIVTDFEVVG